MSVKKPQKQTYLFIDANVWLALYINAIKKGDASPIKNLWVKLQSSKDIKTIITGQLRDEFYRNRDEGVIGVFRSIKVSSLKENLENLLKSVDEAQKGWPPGPLQSLLDGGDNNTIDTDEFKDQLDELSKITVKAIDKLGVIEEAVLRTLCDCDLDADRVMADIFGDTETVGPDIINKAHLRYLSGNPPFVGDIYSTKRKGSGNKTNYNLGDIIHWETLLSIASNGGDLHIVSQDGGFASPIDSRFPSTFLSLEWGDRKSGKIHLHKNVGEAEKFFEENLGIKIEIPRATTTTPLADYILQIERERLNALHDLVTSSTLDVSKRLGESIKGFSVPYIEFTPPDLTSFLKLSSLTDPLPTANRGDTDPEEDKDDLKKPP